MGKAVYSPAEIPETIRKIRGDAQSYDLQPHHLAAELLEECRKKNDIEGMKFWRAVWIQIMTDDYLVLQRPSTKRPRKHQQLPGEG